MENLQKRVLQLMLKPIVGYCLRRSVGIRELIEAAKGCFVELAREEISKSGKRVTVNKLHVMTGIHRKELTRYHNEKQLPETYVNILHRTIARWQHEPEYQTKSGKPRVLSTEGEDSEFYKLVEKVTKGVYPPTVLYELKRVNAVEEVRGGIKLRATFHDTKGKQEEGLELLARDVSSLITGVEENIFEDKDPRNLHLRTEYTNIYKDDIPLIRKWLREQGAEFHKEVRRFLTAHDKDLNPDPSREGDGTVVVTAFSCTTDWD